MGKNKTKKRTRRPNKGWLAGSSATQTICSSFLLVIAVGTLLLTLPISSRTGRLGVIDAMFTATSATCVTGLVVRDTWSQFSLFGQVIILMLIQVGGLGLVTLTSFFALAARRRMGFRDLRLLGESVSADGLSKATEVLKIVIKLAAAFEAVGIVLLLFAFVPQFGAEGVWVSVFTAISAFCNAGFDLFGRFGAYSSLVPYVNNYYVQAVIMFMIMAGGLGFMVWVELAEYRKKRRLSLHAKVVLQFSVIFWVGGAVLLALISWSDSNMAGICFGDSKQQAFTLAGPHVSNVLSFEDPVAPLTVGTVDEFIEYFMARHSEARVDYVHDEPAVRALTRQGGVAFLLPPFEKSDLFKGIVMGGVLPRKTFSMGHAEEKRYYIECRRIKE
mgnify:FL=1